MQEWVVRYWVFILITWLPVGYVTARVFVGVTATKIETRGDAVVFFGASLLGWTGLYLAVAFATLLLVVWSGFFLWLVLGRPVGKRIKNCTVGAGNLFANTCWRFAPK